MNGHHEDGKFHLLNGRDLRRNMARRIPRRVDHRGAHPGRDHVRNRVVHSCRGGRRALGDVKHMTDHHEGETQ